MSLFLFPSFSETIDGKVSATAARSAKKFSNSLLVILSSGPASACRIKFLMISFTLRVAYWIKNERKMSNLQICLTISQFRQTPSHQHSEKLKKKLNHVFYNEIRKEICFPLI